MAQLSSKIATKCAVKKEIRRIIDLAHKYPDRFENYYQSSFENILSPLYESTLIKVAATVIRLMYDITTPTSMIVWRGILFLFCTGLRRLIDCCLYSLTMISGVRHIRTRAGMMLYAAMEMYLGISSRRVSKFCCGVQTSLTILVNIKTGTASMTAIPTAKLIEAITAAFVSKTFDFKGKPIRNTAVNSLQPVTVSSTISILNTCGRILWLMVKVIRDPMSDTAKAIKVSLGPVDKVFDFCSTTSVVKFLKRPKETSKHDRARIT